MCGITALSGLQFDLLLSPFYMFGLTFAAANVLLFMPLLV